MGDAILISIKIASVVDISQDNYGTLH